MRDKYGDYINFYPIDREVKQKQDIGKKDLEKLISEKTEERMKTIRGSDSKRGHYDDFYIDREQDQLNL
jgi:hypothetical protein